MKRTMGPKLVLKAVLALNVASIIRALRHGPRSLKQNLIDSYHAVDPFSTAARQPQRVALLRIPEVTVGELTGWPPEIKLDLRYADVSGSTPIRDIAAVLALAIARQPRGVLEFGTFYGSGTLNLALNLPEARIHTIDLPPDPATAQALTEGRPVDDLHLIQSRQLGKAFRGTLFAERIVQHMGDTASYDYTAIPDEISFFLIDGSHTYEYAKSDTLRAFALAQGESTFVWHDCDEAHPGVVLWLRELLDAGLPVKRITDTVVGCMTAAADDPRIRRFLDGAS